MTGRLRAAMVGAVLTLAAGCGVPTGGSPETIPPEQVPFGLASPTPPTTATPVPEPSLEVSRIYLVSGTDVLVPRGREMPAGTPRQELEGLLADLVAGPTGEERDEQLSTALPPGAHLTVAGLSGGTATIDLENAAEAPSGWAGRQAVAQIVLTATSVPGVDAVLLTLTGDPVDAPLLSGELTSEPLTAADYAGAVVASPTAALPTAAPPS